MDRDVPRVGLIGWPVGHSVSPAMHNAAFEALGMTWKYELFPTPSDEIETRIDEIRAGKVTGANVTIPHKQAVIPFLDKQLEAAAIVGAVNTIVVEDDSVVGYNTDVGGILWALEQHDVSLADSHVVMLGAGGAARATFYALNRLGVTSIDVFNRTPEHAGALVVEFEPLLKTINLTAHPLGHQDCLAQSIKQAELLINTSSVGMHPNVTESPLPAELALQSDLVVFDMVFNPYETRLLRLAKASGAKTIVGLDMLVGQGVESFQIWTGQTPPADVMKQAALDVLNAHSPKESEPDAQ